MFPTGPVTPRGQEDGLRCSVDEWIQYLLEVFNHHYKRSYMCMTDLVQNEGVLQVDEVVGVCMWEDSDYVHVGQEAHPVWCCLNSRLLTPYDHKRCPSKTEKTDDWVDDLLRNMDKLKYGVCTMSELSKEPFVSYIC